MHIVRVGCDSVVGEGRVGEGVLVRLLLRWPSLSLVIVEVVALLAPALTVVPALFGSLPVVLPRTEIAAY